jgi:hypothetical protein
VTAEVALLNKTAIALAADSATTVTYWEKNEPKTRYFKGANKVFNVSRSHPVGIMTFASASLNGVPWEIIIKAYRAHLKKSAHDHLAEYANGFFEFITSNSLLFPREVQEKQFIALCDRAAAQLLIPVTAAQDYKSANATEKASKIVAAMSARENALPSLSLMPRATKDDLNDAVTRFGALIAAEFRADNYYKFHVADPEIDRLAQLAIAGVFAADFSRGSTGLALAGYGESEYFPRLQQYRCHGLILGKSYYELEQEIAIDHNNSADVIPLAQSNMIDTFILGASYPTMTTIHSFFVKALDEFEDKIKSNGLLPTTTNLDALKTEAEAAFRKEVTGFYYQEHRRPLSRVIANLPINELAELAETLVYIESLKERVTTPEESISGPIDVAVISKRDGFIWIKRKHYFKAELNHRFFFNQQREVE